MKNRLFIIGIALFSFASCKKDDTQAPQKATIVLMQDARLMGKWLQDSSKTDKETRAVIAQKMPSNSDTLLITAASYVNQVVMNNMSWVKAISNWQTTSADSLLLFMPKSNQWLQSFKYQFNGKELDLYLNGHQSGIKTDNAHYWYHKV